MKLLIHSKNKGTILDTHVSYIDADGYTGKVSVLENHAPMILPLKETAELEYIKMESTSSSLKETLSLKNAFLEVSQENKSTIVKIITD